MSAGRIGQQPLCAETRLQNMNSQGSFNASVIGSSSDKGAVKGRLHSLLSDPEWGNYIRYEWRHNPLMAMLAPLRIGGALCLWLAVRFLGRSGIRSQNRAVNSQVPIAGLCLQDSTVAQRTPRHLFDEQDIPALTDYARKHLPAEVDALLTSADKIMTGVFPLVSGVDFNCQEVVRWQGPFSDPEQLYYLNRWYHGVTLAKAFVYTGSERYARRFVEFLEQWSAANPTDSTSPVWESYSVGERIVNWLFAHHLLRRSNFYRERGAPLLFALLAAHAEYLTSHLEDRVVHNHLINNARALFTYGLLCPDLPHADDLRKQGWAILSREIHRQFRSDGMLGEQSTHYHLLLLSRYTETTLLAERNGYTLPERLKMDLRRMFSVGNLFVRPDQTLALIGDVSPDATPNSLVGMLAVGSALFNVPSAVRPSEYALWFLGPEGLGAWFPEEQESGLYQLPQSGYAVYRTPELHFVMQCDPRAEVIRHGHHDVLGLDLWVRGRSILADPGNSSFQSDVWEEYFRGPRGHNTIILDELPPYVQNPRLRRLLPASYINARAGFIQCEQNNRRVVFEAQHTGYRRLPSPVTVKRRVQILGEDSVLITDCLDGLGLHSVEILFHLGDNHVESGPAPLTLGVYNSKQELMAEVEFKSDVGLMLDLRKGRTSPVVDGWFSPAYGLRAEGTTVVCGFQMNNLVQVETLISFKR